MFGLPFPDPLLIGSLADEEFPSALISFWLAEFLFYSYFYIMGYDFH